ncbi:MAG: hypothetical protein R3304_05445 [Longimicrobiales bacterium]|nr:hypothetical protein [Longimicrobiales bacterium]
MSTVSTLASILVTVALTVALGALSQWPVHQEPDEAVVRLSWRTEPVRVEECRALTEEELAGVPAHMRRTEECVGGFVDYALTLAIDGRQALTDTLAPSGLRRDRPVHVLHDETVDPGKHRVEVTFSALVPAEDPRREDGSVTLRWSGQMSLEPGEIGLVTLGPSQSRLVHRDPDGP